MSCMSNFRGSDLSGVPVTAHSRDDRVLAGLAICVQSDIVSDLSAKLLGEHELLSMRGSLAE